MNPKIIEKYSRVDWIFAVYSGIELLAIYQLNPQDLDPFYKNWEERWYARGRQDLNNQKIPLKYVQEHGLLLYKSSGNI